MEDITDIDYRHAKKVFRELEMNNLGDYHEIYKLDPAYFLSAPGLTRQACLKKTEVELELLTDPNTLLMFGKGIRGGITQSSHRYAEANN